MGYLADPTKSLSKTRRDPELYESVRYYRDKKQFQRSPKFYIKRFPEMKQAHDLFYHSHYGGWRWFIEALLIAGLSDDEVKDALKVDIDTDVIAMYRKVFFHVDPYIDSSVAISANILSTSRLDIKGKRDCDYTWKLFAYNWGGEAFLNQFANKRTAIHNNYARWFRDLAKECLTINAFQLASDLKRTYNLETLEILRIAKEYWTITDLDMKTGQGLADTDFVSSLSSHVDMCLMNASERDTAIEKRPEYKYAFLDELQLNTKVS